MNLTAKLLFEQIRLPMGGQRLLSGKLRHSIATLDQYQLRDAYELVLNSSFYDHNYTFREKRFEL
jgi:hypothetical protein